MKEIENPGIVELGCGVEPDSRSETRVDIADLETVDVVWDLDETPWPFADASVEGIIMHHVLEHLQDPSSTMTEIARVLEPGGWAEIAVPFGGHWYRDPTHEQYWTYSTPTYYSTNESGEWDYYFDLPLRLIDRAFTSLWLMAPGLSKLSPLLRVIARRYPGDWVCLTPWATGELTIRFEKER